MFTLQEILDSHDAVFVDACASVNSDIGTYLFEHKNTFTIQRLRLRTAIHQLKDVFAILSHPHARTIPGITRELDGLVQVIVTKIKYFGRPSGPERYLNRRLVDKRLARAGRYKHLMNRPSDRYEREEKGETTREVLGELQTAAYHATGLSAEKEEKFDDSAFDFLMRIFDKINEERAVDLSNRGIIGGLPSRADQELFVTLNYLSIYPSHEAALVSDDWKFRERLCKVPAMIGANEFLPFNLVFRESLIARPLHVFVKSSLGDYELAIIPPYQEKFSIDHIPAEKTEQTRKGIRELWQDFAKYEAEKPCFF